MIYVMAFMLMCILHVLVKVTVDAGKNGDNGLKIAAFGVAMCSLIIQVWLVGLGLGALIG